MLLKFAEIDLLKPLEPIYVDKRYNWLSLLVCWGYLPLGMVRLQCHPNMHTFSVEQLKGEILQAFGWKLWEEALAGNLNRLETRSNQVLPAISVVVCTRDRPLSLEHCLQTLSNLDYPTYEVVVVDNCSTNRIVTQVVERSGFRYVREDCLGLNWARNLGIKETKHDIIAYLDDDALATRGWLRGLAQGFEDPGVMAVTGMVMPKEVETPAQMDFERYGGMSKGFASYTIRYNELSPKDLFRSYNWGVGANMAFRRSLFETIGEFDIALDVGTPARGAGDLEFFFRTVAAGYTLRYEPAAMVRHVHRRDKVALTRQIYNNGRSFAIYLLTIARKQPSKRPAVLWFMLRWWIWHWLLRRLIGSLIRRDWWTFRFAFTELSGSSTALWSYRQCKREASRQLQVKRLQKRQPGSRETGRP
jgi:glycosyltransferase involved in cell wall biosynthesis